MDRETIRHLFEKAILDVSNTLNLSTVITSALHAETELKYKKDIKTQIENYAREHPELTARTTKLLETCNIESTGTVPHQITTINIGEVLELEGTEIDFKNAFYAELGHSLYNLSLKARKTLKPTILEKLTGKYKLPTQSNSVSELIDGLMMYATKNPYSEEYIDSYSEFGKLWLDNPSRKSFEKLIDSYKSNPRYRADVQERNDSEFKLFEEPSTAIAAHYYKQLTEENSPETISAYLGLALFDKRISVENCESFKSTFDKFYLKNKKHSSPQTIPIEIDSWQAPVFPKQVTLKYDVAGVHTSHDENPDVGFEALLNERKNFEKDLPKRLNSNPEAAGSLTCLVLNIKRKESKTNYRFHSCECTARYVQPYEIDVVYFG